MAKKTVQPLDNRQRIVDENGAPTQFFIRLLLDRGILQEGDHELLAALAETEIVADAPITGGGVLGEVDPDNPQIHVGHAESGVVPDTYGDTGFTPKITVDEFGHITDVVDVPAAGGIQLEEAGVAVAGGPFSTLNLVSGATAADAGAGVADLTFAGGGGGGGGLTLIQEQILGANQTTVTFSAIPSTYKDLILVADQNGSIANAGGNQPLMLQFNNDTGNNYNSVVWSRFEPSDQVLNTSGGRWGYNISYDNGNRWPSETTIYGYAGNSQKHWMGRGGLYGGGNFGNRMIDGWWASNAPITEIDIFINGGGVKFMAGSKFQLYGRS